MPHLKVIHVITRMDLGGAQANTLYTASHLDRERFDCLVVAGQGGIMDPEVRAGRGFRVVFLPSLVREISPGQDVLALLQLISLFIAEKPDVVHTHSSKAGVLGRLAAWAAGVPAVIHTYHGFGFNDFQPAWTKNLYLWAERLCCALSDRLIFVSNANWGYAHRHRLAGPNRYALIRSGIKLSHFPAKVEDKGQVKASLGLGMHKALVISIGNLKPQKNPGDFVAMSQNVLMRHPNVRFLFIGDGPLRRRLEYQIIALGLHGQLALPGWRRDAARLLASADIFVMTSLWEGLPRALLEAMKTGLPPVCYATDGVADVVKDGENGFLVPVGNVSMLADRVLQLLQDEPLRKAMGAKAAAAVTSEFDIDQMVRQQETLYLECLGEKLVTSRPKLV